MKLEIEDVGQIEEIKRRKKPKTLSGIETRPTDRFQAVGWRRKKPKTLSGIETVPSQGINMGNYGRKKPKTLSGIETTAFWAIPAAVRRKKPKTLSGIETYNRSVETTSDWAGKNLKPYQGLKRQADD